MNGYFLNSVSSWLLDCSKPVVFEQVPMMVWMAANGCYEVILRHGFFLVRPPGAEKKQPCNSGKLFRAMAGSYEV